MNLQYGESETMGLFGTINKGVSAADEMICGSLPGPALEKKILTQVSRLGIRQDKGRNIELLLRAKFLFIRLSLF